MFASEASEGDIALNFVVLSEAERTMGADLTIVLDGHHSVQKTILFDQAAVNNALVGVLGWCVLQRISLLYWLFSSCSFSIWISFIFNFDIDMSTITSEWTNKAIILILVKRVDLTELLEDEVVG